MDDDHVQPRGQRPGGLRGKIRTILAYLDRARLQAHGLSPVDVMQALDRFNIFIPAGDAKFGQFDYALDANAMYNSVERTGGVPVKTDPDGRTVFLKEVAVPKDAAAIQTNVVRVDGRRQVYIPVYRQAGYGTLSVVDTLRGNLPDMKGRLTTPDANLSVVMDQSVYVRQAIESLAEEGGLGAVPCSLIILVFLGGWQMTPIAILAISGAVACLYGPWQTVNLMTLAGLALAISPLVDTATWSWRTPSATWGSGPPRGRRRSPGQGGRPALTAGLCTLLVLLPLTLMPGLGAFLFRPLCGSTSRRPSGRRTAWARARRSGGRRPSGSGRWS